MPALEIKIEPTATICGFTQLADWVSALNDAWDMRWPGADPGLLFRGCDDCGYDLNPTLLREPYPSDPEALVRLENTIQTEFSLRSYPLLGRELRDPWAVLLIGQQHGLPTRLLDWTRSLAVATYFAVRDVDSRKDGAVWVMAGRNLADLAGHADIWRLLVGTPELQPLDFLSDPSDNEALAKHLKQTPQVLAPKQLDERIVAQRRVHSPLV